MIEIVCSILLVILILITIFKTSHKPDMFDIFFLVLITVCQLLSTIQKDSGLLDLINMVLVILLIIVTIYKAKKVK